MSTFAHGKHPVVVAHLECGHTTILRADMKDSREFLSTADGMFFNCCLCRPDEVMPEGEHRVECPFCCADAGVPVSMNPKRYACLDCGQKWEIEE